MTSNPPSMVKPAAIGGAIFGFLAGLPLVGAINCACCALIIGGGFTAAYFHANALKAVGLPFAGGVGAKVGALSGVFYALVSAVVGGIVQALMGAGGLEDAIEQMRQQPNMPPEALEFMEGMAEMGILPLILAGFGIALVLGLIFGTIGGLIGGKVFQSEPPKPAAPAAPDPPVGP